MNKLVTTLFLVPAKYPRLVSALAGGLFLSGLATLVMGRFFGFSNLTLLTVTPGCLVGVTAGFIISHLVVKNRKILIRRHEEELEAVRSVNEAISQKLEAERIARTSEAQLLEIFPSHQRP